MSNADEQSSNEMKYASAEDALAVVLRLRESGHVAYFAGGCVRDMLLGLVPKDYDVATDAPPGRVRELFKNTQAVGAAFGVILVRLGKSVIEVATFRTDLKYVDGRRPEGVVFTTAEEDAKRRDFTINGLFFDPVEKRVIDFVGGQNDLKNKVLRAIGDANHRFEEDHLRLLRAVRFAARFDLQVDPATSKAIREHVPQLVRISPERIAEELRAMLTAVSRTAAWALIHEYSIDDLLFRFVQLPKGSVHPEIAAQRKMILFDHVTAKLPIPFGLALAAAVLEYAAQRLPHLAEWPKLVDRLSVRQVVAAIRKALRVSNDEGDAMEGALYGLHLLISLQPNDVVGAKRFLARPHAPLSRSLLEALPKEMSGEQTRADLESRLCELEQTDYAPPPLVTGDDLTAAGFSPGPVFKKVLDAVYDAQLEGRVVTKSAALELALSLVSN